MKASGLLLPVFFGFEFGAIAVAVDDLEPVIAVAGRGRDTGIAGMPAAVGGDVLFGEAGVVMRLRRSCVA